jgi:hypothetical protein
MATGRKGNRTIKPHAMEYRMFSPSSLLPCTESIQVGKKFCRDL